MLWGELAVAYFMWWQALVKAMHTPDTINISNNAARVLARKGGNRQASTDPPPTASICLQVRTVSFIRVRFIILKVCDPDLGDHNSSRITRS